MLLQKGDLGPESSWSEASSAAANGRATRRKRRGIARRRRDAMEATVDDCLGTKRSFSEKDFCFSFSFFLNFFIFKFFFYFSFLCFKVCGGVSVCEPAVSTALAKNSFGERERPRRVSEGRRWTVEKTGCPRPMND